MPSMRTIQQKPHFRNTESPLLTPAVSTDLASYNRGICYLHTDQADLAAADFEYVMANSTDSQLKTDTQSILDQLKQ